MSNDLELLTRARGLLTDAQAAGLSAKRVRDLTAEAIELLRQNATALDREAVGTLVEIGTTSVTRYVKWSEPGGRYEDTPFPAPSDYMGGRSPVWANERAPELIKWKLERPGRGAGGGRPWRKETADA